MQEEILERIIKIAKKQFKKKNISGFTAQTHIINDLGGDSLDAMEMVMFIEDEFQIVIPDDHLENVKTLGNLALIVEKNIK